MAGSDASAEAGLHGDAGHAVRNSADDAAAHSPGLLDGAGSLFRELQDVAHDYILLAALETKRAGQSLVIMLAAGVMMAILLVSAWLGLVAAGVFGLIDAGLSPSLAILVAVLANLLVAGGLYGVIHYMRRYLAFPATVRNLRPSSYGKHPSETMSSANRAGSVH